MQTWFSIKMTKMIMIIIIKVMMKIQMKMISILRLVIIDMDFNNLGQSIEMFRINSISNLSNNNYVKNAWFKEKMMDLNARLTKFISLVHSVLISILKEMILIIKTAWFVQFLIVIYIYKTVDKYHFYLKGLEWIW